jgi:hypothetical protein
VSSSIEIPGTPPADFSPGQMLDGMSERWSNDIRVSISRTTIGARAVETSREGVHISVPRQAPRITPLSLEIADETGLSARLDDIPFCVVVNRQGEATLSSEQQRTPWRFLLRVNSDAKQMSLSFTLDYSGLSVDKALSGARFYGGLAKGGEIRILGRHPVTGAVLPIARGAIPAGSYQEPDARFLKILNYLAFIESKTGEAFTIPERAISFDEANTIAATARILETGHGRYTAKPWVSVSNIQQAKSALESFASGKPASMAIHFEGEAVVIFGTHVMLGPVTFFCDRTYIAGEDLVDLREQLGTANAQSKINIRFTPFEDCLIEARYMNWLPTDEAVAIRGLPMYQEREPAINEDQWTLPPEDVTSALALLTSWYDEDAEEQKEMWESIKLALDQDRLSVRKLFP